MSINILDEVHALKFNNRETQRVNKFDFMSVDFLGYKK